MSMKFLATTIMLQIASILADQTESTWFSTADIAENLLAEWTPGQGGIYDTCDLQKDIVSFTVEKLLAPDPKCGPFAAFQVCMTLTMPEIKPGVSKTCVKNSTVTDPPDFDAYFPLEWANSSVGAALGRLWKNPFDAPTRNHATQCQIGCSGNPIDFQIVDGPLCRPTDTNQWPDSGFVPANTQGFAQPVTAECHSRPGWKELNVDVGSCTCSSYKQDCVWRVPLPTIRVDESPSPVESSPSPACACPTMSEECSAAVDKLRDDGYGDDFDILDCTDPQAVVDELNKQQYNCALSGEPGCHTIKCETLVTKDMVDQLNYDTCPVQSPLP